MKIFTISVSLILTALTGQIIFSESIDPSQNLGTLFFFETLLGLIYPVFIGLLLIVTIVSVISSLKKISTIMGKIVFLIILTSLISFPYFQSGKPTNIVKAISPASEAEALIRAFNGQNKLKTIDLIRQISAKEIGKLPAQKDITLNCINTIFDISERIDKSKDLDGNDLSCKSHLVVISGAFSFMGDGNQDTVCLFPVGLKMTYILDQAHYKCPPMPAPKDNKTKVVDTKSFICGYAKIFDISLRMCSK